MSDCLFRRARSRTQKAQRREDILVAAGGLLGERPLDRIKLVDIALRSGITKAALYRYFPSREAIFLALYLREMDTLVRQAGEAHRIVGGVADYLAQRLIDAPLFCRLSAVLHTVLEQNLDEEQALRFKWALLERMRELTADLAERFDLSSARAGRLLLFAHQIVIGAWAASHPPPAVALALESGPLNALRVDFADSLTRQLRFMEAAL